MSTDYPIFLNLILKKKESGQLSVEFTYIFLKCHIKGGKEG
jgi:hypothetical protein